MLRMLKFLLCFCVNLDQITTTTIENNKSNGFFQGDNNTKKFEIELQCFYGILTLIFLIFQSQDISCGIFKLILTLSVVGTAFWKGQWFDLRSIVFHTYLKVSADTVVQCHFIFTTLHLLAFSSFPFYSLKSHIFKCFYLEETIKFECVAVT